MNPSSKSSEPLHSGLPGSVDNSVRALVFDAFLDTGAALSRAEIAGRLSLSAAQVDDAFERLAEGHVFVLQPYSRQILMANPFSALPTPFRVTNGTRAWWGNCIWDALGIIAMTGGEGAVETSCPDCGEGLTLEVQGGNLLSTAPLAHITVPAAQWWDDIVFT